MATTSTPEENSGTDNRGEYEAPPVCARWAPPTVAFDEHGVELVDAVVAEAVMGGDSDG